MLSRPAHRLFAVSSICLTLCVLLTGLKVYLDCEERDAEWRTFWHSLNLNSIDEARAELQAFPRLTRKDLAAMLFLAVEGDFEHNVEVLIALGADVNAKNKKGQTVLQVARLLPTQGIVARLMRAGAHG